MLLYIEKYSDVPTKVLGIDDFLELNSKPYVISLHIDILHDAGLIEVMDVSYEGDIKDFDITRLTFAGYEYLEEVRNAKIWRNVKQKMEAVGGATFDIIKQVAVKELTNELGV